MDEEMEGKNVKLMSSDDKIYEVHPITNKKILGYHIPKFEEACKLVCEAAKEIPEIN